MEKSHCCAGKDFEKDCETFRIHRLGQLLASAATRNDPLWVGYPLLLLRAVFGFVPVPVVLPMPSPAQMDALGSGLGSNCSTLSAVISRCFCLKISTTGRHFGVQSRVTTKCPPSRSPSYTSVMKTSCKERKVFFPFPEHRSEEGCTLCGLRALDPPLVPFR